MAYVRTFLDPVAAWAALSPERQAAIGAAALDYTAAWIGMNVNEDFPGGFQRENALDRATEALEAACEGIVEVQDGVPSPWPSSERDIAYCRECGCTDEVACEGGCCWVEPDLCSTCAKAGK